MFRRVSWCLQMHTIALKAGRLVVGNAGGREAEGGGDGTVAGGENGFSSGQASAGAEPEFTVLP